MKDWEVWRAVVHGFAKSRAWQRLNWTDNSLWETQMNFLANYIQLSHSEYYSYEHISLNFLQVSIEIFLVLWWKKFMTQSHYPFSWRHWGNELSYWLVMFVLSFFFLPGKLLPRKPLISSVDMSCWAQTNSWPDILWHILDISSNRDLGGILVFVTPK